MRERIICMCIHYFASNLDQLDVCVDFGLWMCKSSLCLLTDIITMKSDDTTEYVAAQTPKICAYYKLYSLMINHLT